MIPFNKPYLTGDELKYISEAHERGQLAGDGYFTRMCHRWLESHFGCHKALLTHSCTASLEMAAILLDLNPGDEIIMPSYTFVSTANAFVLRGAVPVFVDVDIATANISVNAIRKAITRRTKAIIPVHYAGVSCDMQSIKHLAEKYNLYVIEDAAQAIFSSYKDKPVGTFGDLSCFSFHETKNIISGEGGALIINNPELAERAEIIREKGTDRSKFFRGEVDKYSWVDRGSSYLPGEIIAAFLWAQLQKGEYITSSRISLWENYRSELSVFQDEGLVRLPFVPSECKHNAHLFYLIVQGQINRDHLIRSMKSLGVQSVFHYVPLHSSKMGKKYCNVSGVLLNTDFISNRIVRLPMWLGLDIQEVIRVFRQALSSL